MEFSVLKDNVAAFANRADDADYVALIPTLIEEASLDVQRVLDMPSMQMSATLTLAATAAGDVRGEGGKLAQPPDAGVTWTVKVGDDTARWKRWLYGWVYDSTGLIKQYKLVFVTKDLFERTFLTTDPTVRFEEAGLIVMRGDVPTTGSPLVFTDYGQELVCFPKISGSGVDKIIWLDFLGIVPYAAKADGFEDWFLLNGWDVLLYGALIKSEPYLGANAQKEKWIDLYMDGLKKLTILTTGAFVDAS